MALLSLSNAKRVTKYIQVYNEQQTASVKGHTVKGQFYTSLSFSPSFFRSILFLIRQAKLTCLHVLFSLLCYCYFSPHKNTLVLIAETLNPSTHLQCHIVFLLGIPLLPLLLRYYLFLVYLTYAFIEPRRH